MPLVLKTLETFFLAKMKNRYYRIHTSKPPCPQTHTHHEGMHVVVVGRAQPPPPRPLGPPPAKLPIPPPPPPNLPPTPPRPNSSPTDSVQVSEKGQTGFPCFDEAVTKRHTPALHHRSQAGGGPIALLNPLQLAQKWGAPRQRDGTCRSNSCMYDPVPCLL